MMNASKTVWVVAFIAIALWLGSMIGGATWLWFIGGAVFGRIGAEIERCALWEINHRR